MSKASMLLPIAAIGCNAAFGLEATAVLDASVPIEIDAAPPDRDRDGVYDDEDPCIASIADRLTDIDGDGSVNEDDDCPFDTGGTSDPDADGDGVGDACDPLESFGGDRMRCVMAFQNPTITREVFVPREGDTGMWNLLLFSSIRGVGTGTLVATETFEAPTSTSYDLPLVIETPAGTASFTLWLATTELAAASDLGCEARGDASSVTVALRGTSMSSVVGGRALQQLTRIQATLLHGVSGRNNVRCVFHFGSAARAEIRAEVPLVSRARIGLGIESLSTYVFGLTILERDDAPVL